MTIDDLISNAPTTAHRQLLQLFKQFLDAGGVVRVDATDADRVRALEQQVQQLMVHVRQLEADYQALAHNLVEHTHETIRQVA